MGYNTELLIEMKMIYRQKDRDREKEGRKGVKG